MAVPRQSCFVVSDPSLLTCCMPQVRARSEDDAEEELTCVAVLKRGKKVVAGASDGVLSIFSWGYWNGCSDRYPGGCMFPPSRIGIHSVHRASVCKIWQPSVLLTRITCILASVWTSSWL